MEGDVVVPTGELSDTVYVPKRGGREMTPMRLPRGYFVEAVLGGGLRLIREDLPGHYVIVDDTDTAGDRVEALAIAWQRGDSRKDAWPG